MIGRTAHFLILLAVAAPHAFGQGAKLSEYRVTIPERGEVVGYMVSIESNRFCFLPPPEWAASCKPGGKTVVLLSSDRATSITMEFLNHENVGNPGAAFDRLLASRYADARLKEKFECHTGLGAGFAFAIERENANKIRVASRVIYAVVDVYAVEFALTGPTAKFASHVTTFENVVNSFHRSPR
jgi:hypothetical protein